MSASGVPFGSCRHALRTLAAAIALGASPIVQSPAAAGAQEVARPDLLTLAHGAVPLRVGGAGAELGATLTHATRFVDGDPRGFSVVSRATDETDTEVIYALPAPTTFDRFAVPDVLETPSPSQTFVRSVEVHGSAAGPDGPWTPLASGRLETHSARGQVTELEMAGVTAVSWVRLRLVGGIEMLADLMFLEFGEIVGNGTQESPELALHFNGTWRDRGVRLTLVQDRAVVSGCYDDGSPLTGTVTGNLLKATGVGSGDGVVSHFIVGVTDDGGVRGVRSTNGAPFALYTGAPAAAGQEVECAEPPAPTLGCGSVIHGITFAFDSDVLRPESAPVLERLAEGLASVAAVTIEGHTSSEGSDTYNLDLSERRAGSVVADLVARGVGDARLSAVGRGESVPIASNGDENGRAMNRRVEVRCAG